jgi:hypothetical protein
MYLHQSSTSHQYSCAIEPYCPFVFPSSQVASYIEVPKGIVIEFFSQLQCPIMTPVPARRTWP